MVETNLKVADFLDIHFERVQDIYQPYKKPSDNLYALMRILTILQQL